MAERISIIGCGKLGLPLGQHLAETGYKVKGSTTTAEKVEPIRAAGIEPVALRFNPEPEGELTRLLDTDTLIICLPPGGDINNWEDYRAVLQCLADGAAKSDVSHVLLVSATSVYPQEGKVVRENDAERIESRFSSVVWLDAEEIFTKNPGFTTTVLRFSGLLGPGRRTGFYFAGQTLGGAENPVNMIHHDDCIAIMTQIIQEKIWGETFNASAPEPVSKKIFYTQACALQGLDLPEFNSEPAPFRIVNCDKLVSRLNYHFRYANPLAALEHSLGIH